jgi:hypothetical protein
LTLRLAAGRSFVEGSRAQMSTVRMPPIATSTPPTMKPGVRLVMIPGVRRPSLLRVRSEKVPHTTFETRAKIVPNASGWKNHPSG